ncbi:putative DNA binding domain-containing protein [Helcobacillus massiliensis]|uniref:ATP-binding protein n=1 Tax=Helcobacillus massiliensis TaxID=521392 RepID=UPI0021A68375|nr:ATP-binding protein [Helcobacillus massiliensis]MCT1558017.1 putative DNA binding domain-containing protein [Helcobacillus massiliensis]MCT2036733.1 putative DNA binding domain-containing protein [Helcobacillus massiliensis]MCT2330791.1 putative DNA binding domain-containing protein [Helcobacillus massiliensis]
MDTAQVQQRVDRARARSSDGSAVEIKASAKNLPKSVWESISAFANTSGGLIVLGLSEDDGFTQADGFDPSKVVNQLQAGLGTEAPKVQPVPNYELDVIDIDGGQTTVVAVQISRLDVHQDLPGPCFIIDKGIQRGSFRREHDSDRRLSPYEIHQIGERWQRPIVDRQAVTGRAVADFDEEAVERLISRLEKENSRAISGVSTTAERLVRLNAVTAGGEPTMAGWLTLAGYPQQEFPQLFIDVAVHPGGTKSSDAEVRTVDRRICDGRIPDMISDAVQVCLRHLSVRTTIDGVEGRNEYEIPEEVLREAFTNAVMHRDYSSAVLGQQVAVDLFRDRIEITNPGGLWGDRTVENIADGRSTARNEALVQLLMRVPMRSGGVVAENLGSGVPRMNAAMREHGLLEPQFRAEPGSTSVTIFRHGFHTTEFRSWLGTRETDGLGRDHIRLLAYLFRNEKVSVSEARHALHLDSDDVRVILKDLVARGVVSEREPGLFGINVRARASLTVTEQLVFDEMHSDQPRTIAQLAQATGKTAVQLRPVLRSLVESGHIVATAPPTSRNRAYLRA